MDENATTEEPPFWTDGLPFDRLEELCVSALTGRDGSDAYLGAVAELAWRGALTILGDRMTETPRMTLTPDAYLESAALSAGSDGSVDLNRAYLRKAALEALHAAEERTIAFCTEFAYGTPPAWFIPIDEYVNRLIIFGDREDAGQESVGYALDEIEHVALLYSTISRGDHAPPIASPRPGLGVVEVPSRRGDHGRILDVEWGPYILRLHHHLLFNALIFGLVHECSHLFLGHFGAHSRDPAELRALEIEADMAALDAVGPTMLGDVPSALSVFKQLHLSERRETNQHSLTHPYSAERLLLLAVAIRQDTANPFLLSRVQETLRSFREPAAEITFYDTRTGARQTVATSASSDWDAAYLTATVTESGDGREKLHHDSLVALDVSFVRPVEREPVATARVTALIQPFSSGSTSEETTTSHRVELMVPTPPAWRFRWPDGILRIDRVVGKEALPELPPITDILRAPNLMLWDHAEEDLLGMAQLREGLPVQGELWHELAGYAAWCDTYGYRDESLALRSTLVGTYPELATFGVVLRTLRDLNEQGEHTRAYEFGIGYLERGGIPRPGFHLELARSADGLGDGIGVYDHTFLESLTFGEHGPHSAEAQALQIDSFRRRNDDPVTQALLGFHSHYLPGREARLRRSRKKWLLSALYFLNHEPLVSLRVVSVPQMRAETYHTLWHLGEEWAKDPAEDHFVGLTNSYPWFTGAWVQAAYFFDDIGDSTRALQCFRAAETIAPRHMHVEQARKRFFPQVQEEHHNRAEAFMRLAKTRFGLDT